MASGAKGTKLRAVSAKKPIVLGSFKDSFKGSFKGSFKVSIGFRV